VLNSKVGPPKLLLARKFASIFEILPVKNVFALFPKLISEMRLELFLFSVSIPRIPSTTSTDCGWSNLQIQVRSFFWSEIDREISDSQARENTPEDMKLITLKHQQKMEREWNEKENRRKTKKVGVAAKREIEFGNWK
jgi:hypothetical protein